jgi:arabinogalactan endo-1,4-beta-galactosidase
VQVGNETGNGMLWEDGKASVSMANYATLNNAGYDAVKAVFPAAKVIVHLHNGFDNDLFRWMFDGLKNNGGKWDVIGMSLYPTPENWEERNAACISNINDMVARYNSEVMICEVGMSWDEADSAEIWLKDLFNAVNSVPDQKVLGIFYWEPLAYGGWNGYTLGAFDNNGRPTKALNAFK